MPDLHSKWIHATSRELEPYGLEPREFQSAMDDIAAAPAHGLQSGDRVVSELSGRSGVVREATHAVVLVAYDDQHTNVDFSEAPDAWVPHGVLRRVGRAHVLYGPKDFTTEEYARGNQLAKLVIDGGLGVCKNCGATEVDLDDHPTCEQHRAAVRTGAK